MIGRIALPKLEEPENLKTYAVVVDGTVVNVVAWTGDNDWEPEKGEAVLILDDVIAGIGWDYVDGEFVDNRPVEVFEDETE